MSLQKITITSFLRHMHMPHAYKHEQKKYRISNPVCFFKINDINMKYKLRTDTGRSVTEAN